MATVGKNPNEPEEKPWIQVRTVNFVDLGRSLVVHATASRAVPPIFPETIYRWYPDGLFGVGAFPTDSSGECGPIMGLCLASDPPTFNKDESRRVRIKYWWVSGGFDRKDAASLEVEMFEWFLARLPDWVSHVTTQVSEMDNQAIGTCVTCRMRAVKSIKHADGPDSIVFSRPVLKEMNR